MLAIVAMDGLSLALADPPDIPVAAPPSPSIAGEKSPAEDSTGRRTATQTVPAAASQPATAASAKPIATASDEPKEEKQLRGRGYRPTMINGEKLFCRREAPLGSRIPTELHCVTVAEAKMIAREGRETTEEIQRNQTGCLKPAQGGCGH